MSGVSKIYSRDGKWWRLCDGPPAGSAAHVPEPEHDGLVYTEGDLVCFMRSGDQESGVQKVPAEDLLWLLRKHGREIKNP